MNNSNLTDISTVNGQINISKAIFFGLLVLIGFILNIIVVLNLRYCSLSYSLLLYMRLQCICNIVSLSAKCMCNVIVPLIGRYLIPLEYGVLARIPGALLVVGQYSQYAIQTLMAVNRMIAFTNHDLYQRIFSNQLYAKLCGCTCIFYGSFHAAICLLPCCAKLFDPNEHYWQYAGTNPRIRYWMAHINDMILIPTVLTCYGITMYKLRKINMERGGTEGLRLDDVMLEKRVLAQFMCTSAIWLTYIMIRRPLYHFNTSSNVKMISETQRIILFMGDPFVYTLFMPELAIRIVNWGTFGRVKLNFQAQVAPADFDMQEGKKEMIDLRERYENNVETVKDFE